MRARGKKVTVGAYGDEQDLIKFHDVLQCDTADHITVQSGAWLSDEANRTPMSDGRRCGPRTR